MSKLTILKNKYNNLSNLINRAKKMKKHELLLKIIQLIITKIIGLLNQIKDSIFCTYSLQYKETLSFNTIFNYTIDEKDLKSNFNKLDDLIDLTLNHKFDLLGSGWINVFYNMEANGIKGIKYADKLKFYPKLNDTNWVAKFINKSNQSVTKSIWKNITNEYKPINWHIDFKSGHQWSAKTWWQRIPYGHLPGVDIKVPWEISRMHHLIWLALGYGKYKSTNLELGNKCAIEIQNEILDFIATNPPRYGVNWRCPMDVSIRAANWILSYIILSNNNYSFSSEFNKIFANSLTDHGNFIFNNLEIGKDEFRGNHYLADISGLTWISAFLPKNKLTSMWLDFCFKSLNKEMEYQFHEDYSNFEGSTSYHRLSTEMIFYATIVFNQLSKSDPKFKFNNAYLEKLSNLNRFSIDVTKHDNEIVQIGDCDNGRFFKIQPIFYENTLNENHLSHVTLINAIDAYFGKQFDATMIEANWLNKLKIDIPSRDVNNKVNTSISSVIPNESLNEISKMNSSVQITEYLKSHFKPNKYAIENIRIESFNPEIHAYPSFGLYIWKNENTFFSFRCGKIGQKNRGGHDHNDQLSITLLQNGINIITDPGTGIYTPFPDIRNKYRSATAHHMPICKDMNDRIVEPTKLDQGLFSLTNYQDGQIIIFNNNTILGFDPRINTYRLIKMINNDLIIVDLCFHNEYELLKNKNINNLQISKYYGDF